MLGGENQDKSKRGLTVKFMLFVNSLFFVMGSVLGIILIITIYQSSQNEIRNRGLTIAKNLAVASPGPVKIGDFASITPLVEEIGHEPSIAYALVLNREGTVLSASDPGQQGRTLDDSLTKNALKAGHASVLEFQKGSEDFYDISVPILSGSGVQAEAGEPGQPAEKLGVVRLGISLTQLQSDLVRYITLTASILVALMASGIAISLFFIRYIIAPLDQMTRVAVEMAQGNFNRAIEVHSNDEVGVLAGAFSQMSSSFKGMMAKIQGSARQLALIAGQISEVSRNVTEAGAHQADAAQNSSASIEEMNASVRSISDHVDTVSVSAQSSAAAVGELSAAISQVAEGTTALFASVDETASALGEMSGSIRSVVANTDALSENSKATAASISEMNASIKEAEKNAKESALLSERVSRDASELGVGAVERTLQGMEKIKKTVGQSAFVIDRLENRVERIGKILTVINEVRSPRQEQA